MSCLHPNNSFTVSLLDKIPRAIAGVSRLRFVLHLQPFLHTAHIAP